MIELRLNIIYKIRELRARKKITLIEAAKEIGISAKTLSLIENEKKSSIKKTVYIKIVNWILD